MKLDTVPSRSPWRLYTAVPSTLLEEIRCSVSSLATPAVPVPVVLVVITTSASAMMGRERKSRRDGSAVPPTSPAGASGIRGGEDPGGLAAYLGCLMIARMSYTS